MNQSIDIDNQSELLTTDEQLCYQLRKIMFHNSAAANCFSLEVDKNTLLNGTNGKGKTSKLNAIQIGFLPHTTFKGSDKKYYFVDSEGNHFNDRDCYYYHFPDSNSFIAYEFKNIYGVFTQIVYRGLDSNLGIERAFLPVSLDEIYDWFWVFSKDDELGTPTKISYNKLISNIKSIKGHRFSKSVQENKKLMFNRTLVDEDMARFSIAPIAENKIDNLIDVFKLAVNATSINDKLIKKTVVSLIESSYINNDKDKTNFSPTQLLEQFENLEKDRLNLNNRKNFEGDYINISKSFINLKALSNKIDCDFPVLATSLKIFIEKKSIEIGRLSSKQNEENNAKSQLDEKIIGESSLINQKKGALTERKKSLNKRKPKVEQYNEMLFGQNSDVLLFNGDVEAITSNWEEYITDVKEQLRPFKDMLKTKEKLEQLQQELANHEVDINGIEQALENNADLLIGNPKVIKAETLLAINSAFGLLPDDLSDSEIDCLNKLASLFSRDEDRVLFKGIPFGSINTNVPLSRKDLEGKLINAEQAKRKIIDEISKYSNALGEDWQEKKHQLEQERDKTKKDMELLNEVSKYIDEHNEEATDLEKDEIALKSKEGALKLLKNKAQAHQKESKYIGLEIKKLGTLKTESESIQTDLNSLKAAQKYQPSENYQEIESIEHPHQGHLKNLQDSFNSVDKEKEVILKGLTLLVNNEIIEDQNSELMTSSPSFNFLYKGLYANCQSIYESLEDDEQQLNELAKAHGKVTLDLTKTLSHQISHFKNYVKRLTKDLNTFKLSNVDAMRLELEIEPAVTAFIESINALGVGVDDALNVIEKGLFSQVRKFVKSMGVESQDEFVLTGIKLVKSLRLEYKMKGKWEKKSGSTGTALTSSAMLLSLFIQEMMGKDYSLMIPLNVDETSNLDFANLENIYQFIQDRNLVLFSASPDIPLCADDIFERFINLDDTDIFDDEKLVSEEFRSTYHYQLDQSIEL